MTDTTGNRTLAARARALAAAAAPGSAGRIAAAVAAVALAETRSIRAARLVLAEWDGPQDVIAAALAVLDELARDGAR